MGEERAVLGQLKGRGKKQEVGSIRIGSAKVSQGPGVLGASNSLKKKDNASKPKFEIYQVCV